MRYAVISDIHGNLPGLKAVLEDAEKAGAEGYIFAGDYCLSGPCPDECVSLLKGMENKHIIRGNEEGYLDRLKNSDPALWTDGQMQISYWCCRNVSEDNRAYLAALPARADFVCGGVPVHIAHSSEAFIGNSTPDICASSAFAKKYENITLTREKLAEEIKAACDGHAALNKAVNSLENGVYIFGHTHIQWNYKAQGKDVYLLNPGSCGLPLDGVTNSLPYALLDISEGGEVSIEQKRVPFDTAKYTEALKTTSQYREANVWSRVIIRELTTAREHLQFFLNFAEEYANRIGDSERPFSVETWENAHAEWEKSQGN